MSIRCVLLTFTLSFLTACADDPITPLTADSSPAHSLMPSSPALTSILVDASKGGGLWWYPQVAPFQPNLWHQGFSLAAYMRNRGSIVLELPRSVAVPCELLSQYMLVIATPGRLLQYSQSELTAYRDFVGRGGRLILFTTPNNSPELGEQFGLSFAGLSSGDVTSFEPHPITAGVTSFWYVGSGLTSLPATAVALAYLSGQPIMGIVSYRLGDIFFSGSGFPALGLIQPFVDNLLDYMLADAHPVFSCPITSPDDIAQQLAAMNMEPGELNSLVVKLDAAAQSIAKGQTVAAVNQIRAFTNEAEAMNRSGRLNASARDLLVTLAEELIDYIQQ